MTHYIPNTTAFLAKSIRIYTVIKVYCKKFKCLFWLNVFWDRKNPDLRRRGVEQNCKNKLFAKLRPPLATHNNQEVGRERLKIKTSFLTLLID